MTAPTALVFGASGTLGSAISSALITRGWSVGLHCHRHPEACAPLQAAAVLAGSRSELLQADVIDSPALTALTAGFLKSFERLDLLVWAVGIAREAPLAALPLNDFRLAIDTNLKGFFVVLKAFSRQFLKQKSGSVLALSSYAALAGRPGGAAYAAAHSGLLALVKSAAREWGASGVRVNALIPPFVPQSALGSTSSAEFAVHVQRRKVLKSSSAPDIANFARFALECAANPDLSGQALSADSRI